GNLVVFDLSSIVSIQKKQIIVSYISEKMFALRRKEELPPYVMIVEEAHNFAPEKAEKKYATSKSIINTVAREGRKFGASLCLISQRPVQLSTTALSQCNTMLIMRITNPYDLKHIGESAEAIDADTQNQISSLRVGEGVIIGEAVNYPVFVRIRNRKTKKAGKGETLEDLAKRFEEKQSLAEAISDADVNDAFLQ
ncbi:MAG: ATP-binding protein, partial [Candidatus Micrarchaeota archaeon]